LKAYSARHTSANKACSNEAIPDGKPDFHFSWNCWLFAAIPDGKPDFHFSWNCSIDAAVTARANGENPPEA
jgi:hypothetical protein